MSICFSSSHQRVDIKRVLRHGRVCFSTMPTARSDSVSNTFVMLFVHVQEIALALGSQPRRMAGKGGQHSELCIDARQNVVVVCPRHQLLVQ